MPDLSGRYLPYYPEYLENFAIPREPYLWRQAPEDSTDEPYPLFLETSE